ncbi:conserved hypothetical protein [Betalipothrixvirus acidiani]|uniref:Uncharacterized protein n=1 Tax=Betalipothrixvirus acidiani TaxID=346881 RepID=A7WK93_9VIRU|nr:hypothetical protein AFV3_gp03 [Acidianus filamentous virus 3]CAJ31494.1 conserved hypothetical protein [Acidianus filamentous virus 3]
MNGITIAEINKVIIEPTQKMTTAYAEMLVEDLEKMGYKVEKIEREDKIVFKVENKITIITG